MQSKEEEKKRKTEGRFKQLDERLGRRKQRELESIRNKFSRELRKLANKHRTVRSKHEKRRDIVKFHATRELDFNDLKPRYECSQILQNNFCDEEITFNGKYSFFFINCGICLVHLKTLYYKNHSLLLGFEKAVQVDTSKFSQTSIFF